MKKRIGYIGLSYPLLYDYRNQAHLSENDLSDSPNPIIESPLGLMILYDELWFLCESICPNNMRNLPYVKFVDKMFSDLYYEGGDLFVKQVDLKIDRNDRLSYSDIINRLNLRNQRGLDIRGLDTHTHGFKVGSVVTSASSNEKHFAFDMYIFTALQELSDNRIEWITNSNFKLNEHFFQNKEAATVEKIIISDIPNYLCTDGPYHPCIEELRNNVYLKDFRKWVIENHNVIQNSEINEMCLSVKQNIEETKNKVFKKYLEDNSRYAFFTSTGKTMLKTSAGIVCTPISIADAISGIVIHGKKSLQAKSDRWQGFVVDANKIVNTIGR